MDKLAMFLGYGFMALLALSLFFGCAYLVLGHLGREAYRRLVRVYHLRVIAYWLVRLETEGGRVFEKALADGPHPKTDDDATAV